MDSFVIRNVAGPGSLEFFERTPPDVQRRLERFKVQLTGADLTALARVYVPALESPASLFAEMAKNWRGWEGWRTWQSIEGELTLRCACDRMGHVTISVILRSGPYPDDWEARAAVVAEAGQLEEIARDAERFFGASEASAAPLNR